MSSKAPQEYILAWVGSAAGVLGVVLGVLAIVHPTGFPISPAQLAYSSAAALLAAATITGLWRLVWTMISRPDLEVDHIEIALSIKDKLGHESLLVRTQVDRANRNVSSHPFRVGGISATGQIPQIRIDGQLIPKTDWEWHVNEWAVMKVRQVVLKPGKIITRSFEMDVLDGFPKETESLIHSVSYEMKELRLRVKFPKDRNPRKLRVFMALGNVDRDQLGDPVIGEDDYYISVIPEPKLGAEYRIEWDW